MYRIPGTYTVTLIAQTPSGSDTTIWVDMVTVNGPEVNFSVSSTELCDSVRVQFNNQSNRAKRYVWEFFNDTSTVSSPKYTFPHSHDNYPVKLTGLDSVGCLSSSINILNFPKQYISATASSNEACLDDTIFFQPNDTSFSYLWDFGDGSFINSTIVSHIYKTAGKYAVYVTQLKNNGCSTTVFVDSILVKGIHAKFTSSDSVICKGSEISFYPINLNADTYSWKFGDQDSSLLVFPHFSFSQMGKYDVSLTVLENGCSHSYSMLDSIKVKGATAAIVIQQSNYCFPVQFDVADTSNQSILWTWKVNGSKISTTQHATFSVQDRNSILALHVKSQNKCIDSLEIPVLPKLLQAKFRPSSSVGCTPTTIQFSNLSKNATHYRWNFGDGDTSTAVNPSHEYLTTGVYTVTLISYNLNSCLDTATFNNIHIYSIKAKFRSFFSSSCTPMVVNFSNESTDAIAWFWEFGDGASSSVENPLHIYDNPGNYDITLIVSNFQGCSDTIVKLNHILVPGPITHFSFSDSTSCGPVAIQFTDSYANSSLWNWTFGDGNTSTLQHPLHTYLEEGSYSVTLITTDTNGCTGFFTSPIPIVMENKPVANFSISDTSGCLPFSISLKNNSLNVSSSIWDMGNGMLLQDTNVTHTYVKEGYFNIKLQVVNSIGCKDSISIDSVSAIATPDATILKIDPICENETSVKLQSITLGGTWIGNGVSDTSNHFCPELVDPGIHQIYYKLGGLCPAIDSTKIIIKPTPSADFTSNLNESCESSVIRLKATVGNLDDVKYSWEMDNKILGNSASIAMKFKTGIYDISLVINASNGCSDTVRKASFITIFDSIPLQSNINRVSVVDDSKVWIEWKACLDSKFDHYALYRKREKASNYEEIRSFFHMDDANYTDSLLNTLTNTYCYKILVFDKCGNSLVLNDVIQHCTINVSLEKVSQREIKIVWNAYKGCNVTNYEVSRVDGLTNVPQLIANINSDILSFIDTNVYCSILYSYRIKAIGNDGLKLGSYSDTASLVM
ncbi:MAG: PKD domain-containing protein, partial [Flavobacteriales bacterium]|nr:PKD domain-containing protein [Flavobacteriales bacterium]